MADDGLRLLAGMQVEISSKPVRRRTPAGAWRDQERECPNCSVWFNPITPLRVYCSTRCGSEADFVRYARRKHLGYGPRVSPDINRVLKKRFAFAVGTPYDETARRLPAEVRAQVFDRDRHRCVICGASDSGLEIDHIDGSNPDLSNLQLLCTDCHQRKTTENLKPITDPARLAARDKLIQRIRAMRPLRPCDAADWDATAACDWRQSHQRPRPI